MERYEEDPYGQEAEVLVLGQGQAEPGAPAPFFVDLAETLLYPGGGGQPADRGELVCSDLRHAVMGEKKLESGSWRLYLETQLETPLATPWQLRLDWDRRFDFMQQHTAQHLISAIAEDRFGWKTTSFHLGDQLADIELDSPTLAPEKLAALESAVAAAIRDARPVRARRVEMAEYEALPKVRSRGLPAGHQGNVRLVEIEGIDLATCGGTHLRSTGEIEMVLLLATENMRGGTRLHWVAGGRVRRRLQQHEERTTRLRRLLDCGEPELVSLVEEKLEQLAELRRAKEKLETRLATAEAAACGDAPFVERHFEDGDLPYLQKVARNWQSGGAAGTLFLTAGKSADGAFLIATRGGQELDLKSLGAAVAALLAGKGGGAGRLFQGKAASLAKRSEALALLAAAVAGP